MRPKLGVAFARALAALKTQTAARWINGDRVKIASITPGMKRFNDLACIDVKRV